MKKENKLPTEISQSKIDDLNSHIKGLRKARLKVWDIMFSNLITNDYKEFRDELEQSAASLTNVIANLEYVIKLVKNKQGEGK